MKKALVGCLIVGVLFVVAIIAMFSMWMFTEKPLLDVQLAIPNQVKVGDTVTMVVNATNSHSQAVTLDSVDIDESFLAGFQVLAVAPDPTDTMRVPFMNQRSWIFKRAVPAGESASSTFTLRAFEKGHFTGNVDVCNPSQDFKSLYADVVVAEE